MASTSSSSAQSKKIYENLFGGSSSLEGKTSQELRSIVEVMFETAEREGLNKDWWLEILGYAGFHVRLFREMVMKKATQEELALLINCFLTKGNNFERLRILEKSKIKSLIATLSVKKSAEGNNNTITLDRIAKAFPDIVANTLQSKPDFPGRVSLYEMRRVTKVTDYPALGRQWILACFLPRKVEGSMLVLNVFMLSKLMFSEIINGSNDDWYRKTPMAKFDDAAEYQMNEYNSPLFSEDERIDWCRKLQIMSGTSFTPNWMAAAQSSKRLLLDKYRKSF